MFIKKIEKKNEGSNKIYTYYRLMESYRTPSGPRQKKVLDLGALEDIDPKDHKKLADLIEDAVKGNQKLFSCEPHLEELAGCFASLIIKKNLSRISTKQLESDTAFKSSPMRKASDDSKEAALSSISVLSTRTIGAEYAGLSIIRELGLGDFLSSLGFSKDQIDLAILSIVSRLVYPSSEYSTKYWAQNISALDALLSTSFNHISQNALYKISDKLLSYKDQIEDYLAQKQRDLFSLKDTLILYDLTNTYFEGIANAPKLSFGYSKEKRYDCPLITIGVVIDHLGFVKHTHVFEGNVSEANTLAAILDSVETINKPTIVIDAGIASKSNIELIKQKGFDYICVARNKSSFRNLPFQEEKIIDDQTVLSLFKTQEESILYVQSKKRQKKEESMKSKAKQGFEKKLGSIINRIEQKKGARKYDKVLEQIARLKERYSLISHFYTIDLKQENDKVKSIDYFIDKEKLNERFSGSCYIRTSRTDLDEKQIKDLYSMLTKVEESFRSLKSELGLRPNFHQKQERIEAHIFITTLAYHILNAIEYKLKRSNIHHSWKTIRTYLSSHTLNTISLKTKDNKQLYLSSCTQAEDIHKQIYKALNLNSLPMQRKTIKV